MCRSSQTSSRVADSGHRPIGWSAAGLRLSEATHLKLPDIDSQRMQLKINGGKGGKDRYVPISPRLLEELRTYWKIDRPSNYLFPGKTPDVPLSGATIQKACKLAAALARITKNVTPHTLRHSYATGLLEAGVDLMAIPLAVESGTSTKPVRWPSKAVVSDSTALEGHRTIASTPLTRSISASCWGTAVS